MCYVTLIPMRSLGWYVFIPIAGLWLAGCRQADGPVPAPNENVQAELTDVAKDLQNIATGRDPQATNDLVSDVAKYVRKPEAMPVVNELSLRTAKVVPGKALSEQVAQQLAHNLWVTVAAREMSERQVEALQNDVQSLLMSVGVVEEDAQQVAAQVGEVQAAVTDRPRRWYELF
jgi:hypothetical protein